MRSNVDDNIEHRAAPKNLALDRVQNIDWSRFTHLTTRIFSLFIMHIAKVMTFAIDDIETIETFNGRGLARTQ